MLQTACATTATAASCSPCSTRPASAERVNQAADSAMPNISSAEGRVNPTQAARPPAQPARCSPMQKPVWLEAGPGRNWHSETIAA